jgi:hypothetical protein
VAHGEVATIDPAGLPKGSVITTSGRISGVTEPGELSVHYPFANNDLVAIDDALKYGSRASSARFAVYIGDLGSDAAATPNNAVLLAVSPDQSVIEVVYGSQVRGRGAEAAAPQGVAAASAAFEQGHLVDGLVRAINVLSELITPA